MGLPQTCLNERIAQSSDPVESSGVSEPVIERGEVVALLFNVSDIAKSLSYIEQLLEDDNGEEADEE